MGIIPIFYFLPHAPAVGIELGEEKKQAIFFFLSELLNCFQKTDQSSGYLKVVVCMYMLNKPFRVYFGNHLGQKKNQWFVEQHLMRYFICEKKKTHAFCWLGGNSFLFPLSSCKIQLLRWGRSYYFFPAHSSILFECWCKQFIFLLYQLNMNFSGAPMFPVSLTFHITAIHW